jgi:GDP-4-dehydro-6-deoxy-D-mannose reductase
MRLFICTGGKGTRLESITNDLIPKPMVPILGKPVLHHLIDWAKKNDIKEVVMLNGHMHESITDYFGNGSKFGIRIFHSNEPYKLGSGGPIRYAAQYITGPFVYISGDHICEVNLNKMLQFHNNHKADMTALVHKSSHPLDSDILKLNETNEVVKFISKHEDHTDAGDLSNSGLCIIEPRVLSLTDKEVFDLETELYPKLVDSNFKFIGYHSEEFMADMGTPERLERCENHLLNNSNISTEKERILVTGCGGMMGQHLLPLLEKKENVEVLGTYYRPTTNLKELPSRIKILELDIRDYWEVHKTLADFKPTKILHLAAQSYPTVSYTQPQYTVDTNINGTINIFEAIKNLNLDPIVLVACSSAEYGMVEPENIPILETHPILPLHVYGVTKVAQDLLSYQYFKNDGIKTIRARIFNTTGPKKINDVCSDFTKQAVLIEKRLQEPIIKVGNLETRRAITDVRDMINGFLLLLEKGKHGEVYNISGENAYLIKDILSKVCDICNINPEIYHDPNLMRPTDEKIIYGDSSKLKKDTMWKQEISIDQTLRDMIEYWRKTL